VGLKNKMLSYSRSAGSDFSGGARFALVWGVGGGALGLLRCKDVGVRCGGNGLAT